MPGDSGTQTVSIKYYTPANANEFNRLGLSVRKLGIYSGGYLTKLSDTSVQLSPLDVEIFDGNTGATQAYISTAAVVTVTVGVATPYVVLTWAYTGSAANDYMSISAKALGSILSTDIVVGMCNFSGSTLTGFSYASRTNPNVFDTFLKVEPTSPASMYLRVRAGHITYGTVNYDIADQLTPVFSAPGSNSRIDVVYVNTSGAVAVLTGTSAASPTVPSYAGYIALAEVTVATGATTLTASNIKDVRCYMNGYIASSTTSLGTGYVAGTQYQNTSTKKIQVLTYITASNSGDMYTYNVKGYIGSASASTEVAGECYRSSSLDIGSYPAATTMPMVVPAGYYWKVVNSQLASYTAGTITRIEAWEMG